MGVNGAAEAPKRDTNIDPRDIDTAANFFNAEVNAHASPEKPASAAKTEDKITAADVRAADEDVPVAQVRHQDKLAEEVSHTVSLGTVNDSNIGFYASSRRQFLASLDRNGNDERTKLHFSSWQHYPGLGPKQVAWLHSSVDQEMRDATNTEPGQKTVTLDEAGQAIIKRQKTPDAKELASIIVGDVKRYHREADRINADPKDEISFDRALDHYEDARMPPEIGDRAATIGKTPKDFIQEQRNKDADARADLAGNLAHSLIQGGLSLNADSKTVAAAVEGASASWTGRPDSGREISDLEGHLVRVWAAHQQAE